MNKQFDKIKSIAVSEIEKFRKNVHEIVTEMYKAKDGHDTESEDSVPKKRSKKMKEPRLVKKAKIEQKPQETKRKVVETKVKEETESEDSESLGLSSGSGESSDEAESASDIPEHKEKVMVKVEAASKEKPAVKVEEASKERGPAKAENAYKERLPVKVEEVSKERPSAKLEELSKERVSVKIEEVSKERVAAKIEEASHEKMPAKVEEAYSSATKDKFKVNLAKLKYKETKMSKILENLQETLAMNPNYFASEILTDKNFSNELSEFLQRETMNHLVDSYSKIKTLIRQQFKQEDNSRDEEWAELSKRFASAVEKRSDSEISTIISKILEKMQIHISDTDLKIAHKLVKSVKSSQKVMNSSDTRRKSKTLSERWLEKYPNLSSDS